ncbi:MAG: hypothetical protein ACLRM9_04385 [Collinsella aerofaciens]
MTDSTNAGGYTAEDQSIVGGCSGRYRSQGLKAAGDIALNDGDAFASACGRNGGGEA